MSFEIVKRVSGHFGADSIASQVENQAINQVGNSLGIPLPIGDVKSILGAIGNPCAGSKLLGSLGSGLLSSLGALTGFAAIPLLMTALTKATDGLFGCAKGRQALVSALANCANQNNVIYAFFKKQGLIDWQNPDPSTEVDQYVQDLVAYMASGASFDEAFFMAQNGYKEGDLQTYEQALQYESESTSQNPSSGYTNFMSQACRQGNFFDYVYGADVVYSYSQCMPYLKGAVTNDINSAKPAFPNDQFSSDHWTNASPEEKAAYDTIKACLYGHIANEVQKIDPANFDKLAPDAAKQAVSQIDPSYIPGAVLSAVGSGTGLWVIGLAIVGVLVLKSHHKKERS